VTDTATTIETFEVATPLGTLRGAATRRGLALLAFTRSEWDRPLARLGGSQRANPRHPAARELREYFAGTRREFTTPVDLALATPFAREVLGRLAKAPFGATTTYGAIARDVGRPRGARAVGQAVASNPVPVVVPCHRVVAANGLGGFSGGLDVKRWLLRHEGG
jgi:methylated-DNA-[protein]-cysteine S-methyltransferase